MAIAAARADPQAAGLALVARDVRLSYRDEPVLRGIDLDLAVDSQVAITGASGSGKTSLLYVLAGLERRHTGWVSLLGRDLGELDDDELADLRLRRAGFVFQSADLVPELTLAENVALPLRLARHPRAATRDRVRELIARLGLEGCADRRPAQVSGGQAQRCAVARAVAARPAVVFADEPTGALDQQHRGAVLDLLRAEVAELRGLLVVVTHDSEVAESLHRRVVLVDGLVVADSARPAQSSSESR